MTSPIVFTVHSFSGMERLHTIPKSDTHAHEYYIQTRFNTNVSLVPEIDPGNQTMMHELQEYITQNTNAAETLLHRINPY